MAAKTFDCVQRKREGARRVYEQIQGMTREQELAYWREGDAILAKQIAAVRRKLARQKAISRG